mmetsp:Transcript_47074/g.134324  ORF Transcript_47074/g.134324 Transcript_47074/m.134324 type:complete len:221 (+) Transcript_47074:754-1416(+)
MISSRGSPGTWSPSTTGCQPKYVGILIKSFPRPNLSMPKRLPIHCGENGFRASSSAIQSAFQSLDTDTFLRQFITSSGSWFVQFSRLIMNSVRSLLTSRDHMSAGGEWKMARWKRPEEPGDTRCVMMMLAPSLWPSSVTRPGSPPNAAMFLWTQRRACCWSRNPRLGVTLRPPCPSIQPSIPSLKSKLMKMVGYLADRVMPSPWRLFSCPDPCWFKPPWK